MTAEETGPTPIGGGDGESPGTGEPRTPADTGTGPTPAGSRAAGDVANRPGDGEPPASPRTVLVTGAMGQLGRRVVEILLGRGRTVVALDLRTPATEATAAALTSAAGTGAARGTLVPAWVDLLDVTAVEALLTEHRPSVVVHLAAVIPPVAYRNPLLAARVNVEGTRTLVDAAAALPEPPVFVEASSAGIYGSRNPFTNPERLTADTPPRPADCYGEHKVAAEAIVAASGLPHAVLRLGGIISPDAAGSAGADALVLTRALPRDGRIHVVDARDAALAFANAADLGRDVAGKTLLIGGDESCVLRQWQVQDDLMNAFGLGRLGPGSALPGDPADDDGWGLTDWFDTREAQELLRFQEHTWDETVAWVGAAQGRGRVALRVAGPVLRPLVHGFLAVQRRREGRGPYADPWTLIRRIYGPAALAAR